MDTYKTIDEYIAKTPAAFHHTLQQLRNIIKETAPKAQEKISYGMPYFEYKGRLVYFALAKKHIGLYIPPPIIQQHEKQLSAFVTSKSAIQFPLDKDLPIALIKTLIRARMKYNEENEKKK